MTSEYKTPKTLNRVLWAAQGLLALTFVWAGCMKLLQPEALPFGWIKDKPHLVLLTGSLDLLAGLGIVVPALFRIRPELTIFAAYGIVVLMTAASVFHVSRGEAKDIGFNLIMALLAVFVAWGRKTKASQYSRQKQH